MELGGIVNAGDAALRAPLRAATAEVAGAGTALVRASRTADHARFLAPAAATADGRAAADAVAVGIPPGFFDRPAADLAHEDWRALAKALASDPHATVLYGPRTAFDAPDLRLVVDSILLGHRDSITHAERYFAAWRAAAAGADEIGVQAHALLRRPPKELTSDEWRRLGQLVDADPSGAVSGVPAMTERQYAGLRQTITDFALRVRGDVDQAVDMQFRRWVRDNDPAYPARLADAADAAIAGRWTADQYWTLRAEGDRIEELVSLLPRRTSAERRQVAFVVADGSHAYLAGWMQRHDDQYEQLLREAVDAVADGTPNRLQKELLRTGAARIDELTAGRPLEARRRVALSVLSGSDANDWSRANDPSWARKVEEALDAVIAGTSDYDARSLLRGEGQHLAPVLARRPYAQQLAYQTATLGDDSEQFIAWLRANAPDWEAQLATAVEEAASGARRSPRSTAILTASADRIDEFLAGRPYGEQDRIAKAVLHHSDYYEWNLANNPEARAKATAAIDRIIRGEPRAEGDGIIFVQEKDRIDLHTAGHPPELQERIAREVLGERSMWFAAWMARNDPRRAETLRAAADAAAAGTHTPEQFAALRNLGDDLPRVLEGRSIPDRVRIISAISRSAFRNVVEEWRASLQPELAALQRRAADDAARGELSADARVVLAGETARLDELTAGADYETQLRIADAILGDGRRFQEWKATTDTARVARVSASANAIADGTATPHDLRVLRGERDVLGVVRDRPYEERLRVAEIALDDAALVFWTRANDPTYRVQLVAAIDAAASGNLTDDAKQLLASDRSNVFTLLAERPAETQNAVAAAMLGHQTRSFDGPLAAMRDLALDARTRLAALPDVPVMAELRASTTELLDRNIQRMSGFSVNDPNRGYSVHPDYAEMGRVQANLELLESIAKGRTTAANAAEVLSW